MTETAAPATIRVVVPGLLVLMSPFAQLAYIPVSVGLGQTLGLHPAQVGITVGAHSLATAVGTLLFGPVLDLVPVRRVLPVALLLNVAVSVVLWLEQSYAFLLVGRTVTGLTSAVIVVCALVLVSDPAADENARDRGVSWMQTFQSMGAALGLGLGAVVASIGTPDVLFLILACNALVAAAASPFLLRRVPGPIRSPRTAVLRGMGRLVTAPRMLWLMGASLILGLVIQGSHFGVGAMLEAAEPIGTLARVAMSVLIPLGVFGGSWLSRLLLGSRTRLQLYPRLYLALPLVVLAHALVTGVAGAGAAMVVPLLLIGTVLGATMPLGVALGIGWYPGLRATAVSAEALSRQLGATVGPVLVGVASGFASLRATGIVLAVVSAVGVAAAFGAVRGAAARH